MTKIRCQFRLSENVYPFLVDMAERTGQTMTSVVELGLLDLMIKDKMALQKEIELGKRNTCYHGVPVDNQHFCNKCHRLGYRLNVTI